MARSRWLIPCACFALCAPFALFAQEDQCGKREPAPGVLVTAAWLQRHRQDSNLVILAAERSPASYDSAHVAGARLVTVAEYAVTRSGLLTELPTDRELQDLFERLGLGDRGRIVLYGDLLPVSRLFFTLDYLGLGDRVSVLDGGLAAWREREGAIATGAPPSVQRSQLRIHPQSSVLVDGAWVEAHLHDSTVTLLDARSPEEFDGSVLEEGVARAGHIPGAKSLDWTTTVNAGRLRSPAELRQLLSAAGVTPGKRVVTYCRVGSRASELYLVARILGVPVQLYDGSMNEWTLRADRPVEKKPQ
jgi:thiosulfate/3-mercaptopyruvate sulfurtransferase